jgi:hypothetical protein
MKTEKRNYLTEIEYLKNWSITALQFMANKDTQFKVLCESVLDTLEHAQLINNKKMLQGFEEGVRDFKEWAKGLSPSDYKELNAILNEKFGMGLEFDRKKIIAAIIKRGKIRSDDEYRLIDEQVDELCQTNRQSHEIELLNKLLLDFDNNT